MNVPEALQGAGKLEEWWVALAAVERELPRRGGYRMAEALQCLGLAMDWIEEEAADGS